MVRWVGQGSAGKTEESMLLEEDIIALHSWGKLGHGGFGKLNHTVWKSIPQEVIQEKGLGFKLRETI